MGCAAVDDILYVTKYPNADRKVPVLQRRREVGGLTARALLAASALGAKCAYAAILGYDDLSEFVLSELSSAGVEIETVRKESEASAMHTVAIVSEAESTRNTFFDDRRWQQVQSDWPPVAVIGSARVLLLDNYIGVAAAIRAASIARDAAIPVVADLEVQDARFFELFDMVDHPIISQPFAEKLTGQADPAVALEKLWTPERVFLAITAGQDGCWYRCGNDPQTYHQPAFRVTAADTTGCGDVFHGAYAAALAGKRPARERIQIASAAAALKAQGIVPAMEAVNRMMEHSQA